MANSIINDWENLKVLHRNRMPDRAYFIPYPDKESAMAGQPGASKYFRLLNGIWKFCYSQTPSSHLKISIEKTTMSATGMTYRCL